MHSSNAVDSSLHAPLKQPCPQCGPKLKLNFKFQIQIQIDIQKSRISLVGLAFGFDGGVAGADGVDDLLVEGPDLVHSW